MVPLDSSNSMLGPRGSTVTFDNLSYEVKDKKEGVKRLVDNVSVKVSQGQVSGTKVEVAADKLDARYSRSFVRRYLAEWILTSQRRRKVDAPRRHVVPQARS